MADAIHGVGASKQDLLASLVQKELQFQAKLTPYFWDLSQFAVPGAQSISFPKMTSFSVVDRASATAGDATVLTHTYDKLDLEWNAYIAWIIDSSDEIQSSIAWKIELAKRASSSMARYVDTKILDKIEAEAKITTTAGALTRDIFLEMREYLVTNHANLADVAFFCGPDTDTAMLKLSQFTEAQVYGFNGNVASGVVGQAYGVKVVVHPGIGANTYYMGEKYGLGYGFQKAPGMSTQPANEFGSAAERTAMDQLFGVKGLQIQQGTAPAGKSALLVKDNN